MAGGLVDRPVDHVFSGHREIVKGIANPIIDADDCLLNFGQTLRDARKSYLSSIRLGCRELGKEAGGEPGSLRNWLRPDRDLAPDDQGPYIDVLGRSTGPERDELTAIAFIERSASVLNLEVAELMSRSRQQHVVEARRLLVSLGRERWGQSTKELASARAKSADPIPIIQREGVRQRRDHEALARRYENHDKALIGKRQ